MEYLSTVLLAWLCQLSSAARLDGIPRYQLSRRSTSTPAPIEFPASQDFDGNDGPWSSFALQLGTPPQTVKVLISTASDQTWAVLPQGCTSKDPSNCQSSRGGFFVPEQSHTWMQNNITNGSTFSFHLESNLGYFSTAKYGFDTVTLGWRGSGGPSLKHQVVAGVATKDFYLGLFGINPRSINFTNFDNTFSSFMSVLKDNSMIPSVSYAYTAGNQYRLNKVFGSLTLGGYDSSRFIPNEVRFPFDQADARDLTLIINSITMTAGGTNSSLMSKPIRAFVDSTVPYLWLPLSVCEQFEAALGLNFNDTIQGYLVNDTLHQKLLEQDASLTFTLGNSVNITERVDVTLPYAAFDLITDYPLSLTPSRYFPLMRATNDSQYTLGRTFLQEAYLIADYERSSFTISQCDWRPTSQQPKIVAIKPDSSTLPHKSDHVSTKIIVGSAIGGAFALILALAPFYWLYPRIKSQWRGYKDDIDKAELETSPRVTHQEIGSNPLSQELDSTARLKPELEGDINQIVEGQDQHDWLPEVPGEDGHLTRYEMIANQDWVAELQSGHRSLANGESDVCQGQNPEMPPGHTTRIELPA